MDRPHDERFSSAGLFALLELAAVDQLSFFVTEVVLLLSLVSLAAAAVEVVVELPQPLPQPPPSQALPLDEEFSAAGATLTDEGVLFP